MKFYIIVLKKSPNNLLFMQNNPLLNYMLQKYIQGTHSGGMDGEDGKTCRNGKT